MQHFVLCKLIKLDGLDSTAPFWKCQSSLRGGILLAECVNKFHVLETEIKREPMKTKFTLEEVTWCKEIEKH